MGEQKTGGVNHKRGMHRADQRRPVGAQAEVRPLGANDECGGIVRERGGVGMQRDEIELGRERFHQRVVRGDPEAAGVQRTSEFDGGAAAKRVGARFIGEAQQRDGAGGRRLGNVA